MEETVTLTRLGITGNLHTTLQSTNAIESMISILRDGRRDARAEQQFRRIIGYSDVAKLAIAVERNVAASRSSTASLTTAEPAATLVTA